MVVGMKDIYRYLWGWFIGDGMLRWGMIEGYEWVYLMFFFLF